MTRSDDPESPIPPPPSPPALPRPATSPSVLRVSMAVRVAQPAPAAAARLGFARPVARRSAAAPCHRPAPAERRRPGTAPPLRSCSAAAPRRQNIAQAVLWASAARPSSAVRPGAGPALVAKAGPDRPVSIPRGSLPAAPASTKRPVYIYIYIYL